MDTLTGEVSKDTTSVKVSFFMAKQRIIHTKFWSDKWVRKLEKLDRYLFMYLLTNEHTNICGVYELPFDILSNETGLTELELPERLRRLEPKAHYIDEWVILPNFIKHQNLKSPKIRDGVATLLKQIPPEIHKVLIPYGYPMDKISHLNLNLNLNLNSNLKGIVAKPPNHDIKSFLDFFFRATKKIRHIEPSIHGDVDAPMVKLRLEKNNIELSRLEQMALWYLTRMKKRQDKKGNWVESFKNPPAIATMLSNSYLNELLSEEKNARDYLQNNLDWVEGLYDKDVEFERLKKAILKPMVSEETN